MHDFYGRLSYNCFKNGQVFSWNKAVAQTIANIRKCMKGDDGTDEAATK
jgi:hypothetical protein